MKNRRALTLALSAGLVVMSGCDREGEAGNEVRQTGFPGMVSSGGMTSGEVMARAGKAKDTPDPSGTPGIPQGAGGTTGGVQMGGTSGATGGPTGGPAGTVETTRQEGVRGQTAGGTGSSGTPGIPEGAGGTPSGAAMGGTTSGAAASQVAPPPGGTAPTVPAEQAQPGKP